MKHILQRKYLRVNQSVTVSGGRLRRQTVIFQGVDFDLSVIETQKGLKDKYKECMDSTMNFLKDYYYVTIELDVTSMNENDWNIKEFNPHYLIFYMDNELGRVMEEPRGIIYTGRDMSDKT